MFDVLDPTTSKGAALFYVLLGQHTCLTCAGPFARLKAHGGWSCRNPHGSLCGTYYQNRLLQYRSIQIISALFGASSMWPCMWLVSGTGFLPVAAQPGLSVPQLHQSPISYNPHSAGCQSAKDSLLLKWFKSLVVLMIQMINVELWIK